MAVGGPEMEYSNLTQRQLAAVYALKLNPVVFWTRLRKPVNAPPKHYMRTYENLVRKGVAVKEETETMVRSKVVRREEVIIHLDSHTVFTLSPKGDDNGWQ